MNFSLGLWDCGRIADTLKGMPRSHLFLGVERGLTRVSGSVVYSQQDPEPLGRLSTSYKLQVTVSGFMVIYLGPGFLCS